MLNSSVTNGAGVLTYLANLIRVGDRATPYSMVTAAGAPYAVPGMNDDEMLVNEWLANDLKVKAGDKIELTYYVVDSGSHLVERTNSFRVRKIVPLEGVYADRSLMPDFPGIAKAESTHDWDTGFPLVYKIREKDETYWKAYRGTPKAFITLVAGQAMWANRFGSLTGVRYQAPSGAAPNSFRDKVYWSLRAKLAPTELGFRFQPVREQALNAAEQSQDFGQLFLAFSFFLVLAALLLMALLFQLGLEQRLAEIGTFLALGFRPKQVRRMLLLEGSILALLGGVMGAAGGLAYAKGMLWGLNTIWKSAVGGFGLTFHLATLTVVTGIFASTAVGVLTIWLTLRKQARRPVHELLVGAETSWESRRPSRGLWVGIVSAPAGLGIVAWAFTTSQVTNTGAFFSAGSLLLISGLGFVSAWLAGLARSNGHFPHLTNANLAVKGCGRRHKRSLATVALLACGCFVIVSIGVFRLDANRDAFSRSSGTGGFALIGESTMPVVQDLNTQAGREFFGLNASDLAGVQINPIRVRQGDDASCLNLNRAQRPRLLGVNPESLIGRFSFAGGAKEKDRRNGWGLLKVDLTNRISDDEIPAIGDADTIEWALGKKIGDKVDYTDERGQTFKLRLVGAIANSILQGSLIIDEAEFVKRFPGESGYRLFLVNAPFNSEEQISANLCRALQDVGLELEPAAQKLNSFNAVQNTYLGTFQILGGLGLLLGSAGLGVIVLRNVLERRGELALLLAVGFRRRGLRQVILTEHGALLCAGLGLGILSGAIAVLPSLLSSVNRLPYGSLALTFLVLLLNGAAWTWLATSFALRGNLLQALRNE
jgi:putative ABC transport system permease protein